MSYFGNVQYYLTVWFIKHFCNDLVDEASSFSLPVDAVVFQHSKFSGCYTITIKRADHNLNRSVVCCVQLFGDLLEVHGCVQVFAVKSIC